MKKGRVVLFSFPAIIFVVMMLANLTAERQGAGQVKKFSSEEELRYYIETNMKLGAGYQRALPETMEVPGGVRKAGEALEDSAVDFSTTNIQVAGVDEADIVKSDGKYLYLISGRKAVIVEAYPPEKAKILSRIGLDGEPCGIFINKNRLIVFANRWSPQELSIRVYDVADREKPVLKKEVAVNGNYVNSRMIEDYVYLIAVVPVYLPKPAGGPGGGISLPEVTVDGRAGRIPAPEIYYFGYPDYSYRYTVMLSLNILDERKDITKKAFLTGFTQNIFVSRENIYLTALKVPDVWILRDGAGRDALPPPGRTGEVERTAVHKLSIADGNIEYKSRGEVPGRVLNQFSMDENQGFFRIATTTERFTPRAGVTGYNNIYIMDEKMNIAGSLEGLAPGERIYSARFMGSRAYLVTFRQVDPLFVLDLKDPRSPKVLGELKIPGYSDYLHPYDENHLIGIGKEVTVAPEPLGESQAATAPSAAVIPPPVQARGVKIALFDVTDPAKPKEMSRYVVDKERSDSPALRDHRAFLFSRAKELLALPISCATISPVSGGPEIAPYFRGWQGAYVFDISLTGGISLKGRVEHGEGGAEFVKGPGWAGWEVKRLLYIGQALYTISDKMVKMNDLDSMEIVKQVYLQ